MKAPPNDHRTRVLVVDDEKALAGMIANYLDRAGHRVRVEHTGTDAVSAARDWVPDVIVLDLGLPGLDGVEVCRRVRTFSECMVLMVTARDDETDTLIGLSVGADVIEHLRFMIVGALIIFFLIFEPHGLARLWQIGKQKLLVWPFPY